MPATASPSYKLTRTVHRTVEVRLAGDFIAPSQRLVLTDQTSVQIGINRHLLAGHGIQSKAGCHLRDTAGTFGDHHKVNNNENGEKHQSNRVAASDNKVTKGLNHISCRTGAGMPLQQHH